jgi:hypothetical protein
MGNPLTTYALLGYLKETSSSKAAITELYTPLVQKALSDYAAEKGLTEYKGKSLEEISQKVKLIFDIEIPLPILAKIMEAICKDIDDPNVFALYNDGAFIIKSYVFNDIDDIIEQGKNNIEKLSEDYRTYCVENGYQFDFDELKKFILTQQIELFTNKQSNLLDVNYFVPKYVSERITNDSIFRIMSSIYLGSIIAAYLEQNITKKVTDAELLLDTNFFISLIDLNTEDAHHTCNQLFSLCKQLGYRFTILNSTVNQIRVLLSNRINDFASRDFIGSVRCADVFNACIRKNLDKTGLERIKDNIQRLIEEKGIVIVHDAQIKDLIEKAKRSQEYKELYKRRGNADSALNDTVAKFYVENKRGQDVREFVDAKCWFLHNSFSPYDYSYGRKIHERYLISANELLVLLWLSSPAQGQQIKINDVAKSGLASYITKYRRSKMPTRETLKLIKKRVDDAESYGRITEKDTFNLCIRMAEGHLTQKEVDESLIADHVSNEQFAEKLKEYTNEVENSKQKQKQDADTKIDGLNKKIEEKDSQIQSLNERLESLEKDKYQKDKNEFVNSKMSKLAKDTMINILLVLAICALWCVNEFYKAALPTNWSTIIAIVAALATTFGTLFFRKIEFKDYFCRKGLRKRLEKEFDDSHNTKSN